MAKRFIVKCGFGVVVSVDPVKLEHPGQDIGALRRGHLMAKRFDTFEEADVIRQMIFDAGTAAEVVSVEEAEDRGDDDSGKSFEGAYTGTR